MGGDELRIGVAAGLDQPGQPLGTDATLVMRAIDDVSSADGVLVLMDLGSAVLSAEMALDLLPEERRGRVLLTRGAARGGRGSGGRRRRPRRTAGESGRGGARRPGREGRAPGAGGAAQPSGGRQIDDAAPTWAGGASFADRAKPARPPRAAGGLAGADGRRLRRGRDDRERHRGTRPGGCQEPERRGHPGRATRRRDRGSGSRAAGRRRAGGRGLTGRLGLRRTR